MFAVFYRPIMLLKLARQECLSGIAFLVWFGIRYGLQSNIQGEAEELKAFKGTGFQDLNNLNLGNPSENSFRS
jgi:hypothetical protein